MDSVRSGRLGREKVFLQRRLSLEQSKWGGWGGGTKPSLNPCPPPPSWLVMLTSTSHNEIFSMQARRMIAKKFTSSPLPTPLPRPKPRWARSWSEKRYFGSIEIVWEGGGGANVPLVSSMKVSNNYFPWCIIRTFFLVFTLSNGCGWPLQHRFHVLTFTHRIIPCAIYHIHNLADVVYIMIIDVFKKSFEQWINALLTYFDQQV